MSYARFGWGSDVYVYMDVSGHLSCCGCSLSDVWAYDSTDSLIDHLAEHRAAGHEVPDIEGELRDDEEDNFPPQCAAGHAWGEPRQPFPEHPGITRRDCTRCGWTS
jgi:hypothetical protein